MAFFDLNIRMPLASFDLRLKLQSEARILGLFGPSGCGKSSSLQSVAGLRRATGSICCGGRVLLDSEQAIDLPPSKRGIGYVPQNHCLFPHWDVRRNLLAGLPGRRPQTGAQRRRFDDAVAILQLGSLLPRRIGQLSGGERQRVALGRALCAMPDLLLLDEPLASLDATLKQRILPFLLRVREEFDLPILIVSHNPIELNMLCDEVAVLERGRVVVQGRPLDVFTRAAIFPGIATAFENILQLDAVEQSDQHTLARICGSSAACESILLPPVARFEGMASRDFRVGIAASDLLVALEPPVGLSARNRLASRIIKIEPLPNDSLVIAELHGCAGCRMAAELTTEAVRELALAPGVDIYLVFKSNAAKIYL
jgi:molybdate transport system ATP-binding protein